MHLVGYVSILNRPTIASSCFSYTNAVFHKFWRKHRVSGVFYKIFGIIKMTYYFYRRTQKLGEEREKERKKITS